MFCSQCGTQIIEGSKFCHNCGNNISSIINNNEYKIEEKDFYYLNDVINDSDYFLKSMMLYAILPNHLYYVISGNEIDEKYDFDNLKEEDRNKYIIERINFIYTLNISDIKSDLEFNSIYEIVKIILNSVNDSVDFYISVDDRLKGIKNLKVLDIDIKSYELTSELHKYINDNITNLYNEFLEIINDIQSNRDKIDKVLNKSLSKSIFGGAADVATNFISSFPAILNPFVAIPMIFDTHRIIKNKNQYDNDIQGITINHIINLNNISNKILDIKSNMVDIIYKKINIYMHELYKNLHIKLENILKDYEISELYLKEIDNSLNDMIKDSNNLTQYILHNALDSNISDIYKEKIKNICNL